MRDIQDFDSLMIKLASPETIRSWSYGEVKKPETINYRTLRPEKDGLFCERIFGTTKEWECFCGKFKSIRYKGVVCDRCGVEVTHFKVRRERMGHIELAAPVSHIWYYRSVPSRMGLLLDLQVAALRSVLYYEKYIVIDAGDTDLKKMQLLTEDEYIEAQERYGGSFSAGMGAEAIKTLLENLNLDELAAELRAKMVEKGAKSDKRLLKRIEIVENFRSSGNKCSWMILDVIPVIPPELRPMVQLDGGRFATSDLNDLYRRVINRNNRLKRLMQLSAPDIIIRNEKRMLQEAVDALFDNSKRKRVVKGASNRPLKSISDMLKGKQGRFRQNLLGKRVDYSGRSVIVVGPELKLWQCGLPTKMALELFKPFIMKKLVDKDVVYNVKKAKMLVEQESPEVFAILDEVVREHPVMLNRAPTLHRLGIQAFEPVLVEGKAIKLHPLVCHAFNADFDGDQMAVHVPLTQAAQMECWTLMLSARNLLDPANGKTIVYPSQDMVLGIYYLTKIMPSGKGTGKRFSSVDEVFLAAETKSIDWQAEIKVPVAKAPYNGQVVSTTAGRLRFNEEMPADIEFVNALLGDKELKKLIEKVYKEQGPWLTVQMLDAIKAVGYKYATFFGATISMDDIIVPPEKEEMIGTANKKVDAIQKQYHEGHITQDERYNRVCDIWSKTNEELTNIMMKNLEKDKEGFNTIYMMATSGARGSRNQIRQLAGMRGLMAKPNGDIIELPIRANFKEGLSVIEFFISTNGARKGLSDTALKTADAGYLTRRLVDIAQDVVINEDDCGTINGIEYSAVKDGDEVIEALRDRIVGRYTLERVLHPITHELLCDVNEYITDDLAAKIDEAGVESIKLRTVLTCESRHGVCCKCYGRNLAHNKIVEIGEAVGIIAAQSIGQPGTQLTMRTFHVGGTASKVSEENHIVLKYPVLIQDITGTHVVMDDGTWLFTRKGSMLVTRVINQYKLEKGDKLLVEDGSRILKDIPLFTHGGKEVLSSDIARVIVRGNAVYLTSNDQKVEIQNGSSLLVKAGDFVAANDPIATFDPFSEPIIAEVDGYVHFEDIIPGSTLAEVIDEETGKIEKTISELHLDTKQPRILITDEAGNEKGSYYLPGGAYLLINDNETITAGTVIAKTLKEASKTNDITGGLPRVSELFEARKPKSLSVLSQISGTVQFKGITKGKRVVVVVDKYGKSFDHLVPMTKRLLVRDGDTVEAGEKLCDGALNPHDILAILGENALQNYLMDEIQQVYRMQGVSINDKHIGVIVRQMLRKVEIVAVGDTRFIYGQQVDKYKFHEENRRVMEEGGQPAIARPMFQGITKAALNIDSFISAASFQETTRVLTNAAIAGSTDYLRGLKENVTIGHLIPAGTGIRNYRNVKLFDENATDLDEQMNEIIERRKLEKVMEAQVADTSFDSEED
ncbi:DNA-directed RNA polymerase subunit beta' [Treponema brennaborense]|uniref:DNA-directed RNA polymerase subunit beta' n=1 Tax=Treponema brennaborense (strain DSM 12168 / CIP 105900 / DD5/3) TaxID=906968 RepID=F4LLR5_TREBD|nr:DNA-directed RNA polymerase subunit beta' [Treponema brennaborense]AEE17709.1 DNA-directed RNA polymerase subunit beta' [Treponema brennaborense DSM 12168]